MCIMPGGNSGTRLQCDGESLAYSRFKYLRKIVLTPDAPPKDMGFNEDLKFLWENRFVSGRYNRFFTVDVTSDYRLKHNNKFKSYGDFG